MMTLLDKTKARAGEQLVEAPVTESPQGLYQPLAHTATPKIEGSPCSFTVCWPAGAVLTGLRGPKSQGLEPMHTSEAAFVQLLAT